MFQRLLAVICLIFCIHPLKSSAMPGPCHRNLIDIDSLNISQEAKNALLNSGISIEELIIQTEEDLLRRFNIDRGSIQEAQDALNTLAFRSAREKLNTQANVFKKKLGLSTKTAKKLVREDILSVKELTSKTEEELLRTFDIGPASVQEIKEALRAKGLSLSDGKNLTASGLSPFDRFKRLGLSTKTAKILLEENIKTIKKLTSMTEEELSRKISNIGTAAVQEIRQALNNHGLSLASSKDINAPNLLPLDHFRRLGLSIRTAKKLIRENITSVEELTTKTEEDLLNTFDIGPVSVQEIKTVLNQNDLTLFPDDDNFSTVWPNLHSRFPSYRGSSHSPEVGAQPTKK